jgi:predicted ATPase/DNA-binding CsgD family transcriptional regulator
LITHGGRLPAETSRFFGRSKEAAAVRDALPESRLVTLTGPGGVGKTRLALRVADELAAEFPDGVRLIQLSAVRDADGLLPAVAAALGLGTETGAPVVFAEQAGRLAKRLSGSRQLLILDTCEHLVDACAALVDTVLSGADGPVVLATSRQPLDLPGEVVFRIPPLTVTCTGVTDDGGDAVALFAERARAALPGFVVTDDTLPKVAWLCRALDGIPLEIELAALRLRAVGLDELLARLPGRLRSLAGGHRADVRQQTVQASITWSYDLCTPAERLLWTRLSVFSGGFGLAALEAVCGGGDLAVDDVLETLIGLVEKSVVLRADAAGGDARYRLLEVVREQGAAQRCDADAAACAARHRDYYLGVAASFVGPGQVRRVSRLAQDAANLRLALEWSLAAGQHDAERAAEQDLLRYVLAELSARPARDQPEHDPPAQAALVRAASARPPSGQDPGATDRTGRWRLLTSREREVAALVAKGMTNKDIAAGLFVSKRTIDAHVEHILAKLCYASRVQIAALVARDQARDEEPGRGMEAGQIPVPRTPQEHVSAPRGASGPSVK